MENDIEVGNVFSWGTKPILTFRNCRNLYIHDGYMVIRNKPKKWWHLRSWYRILKVLWRMP